MKAIRAHAFGGPENLILEEVATPTPGPGQVLIDVKAAGVNPADTYMLTGSYAITPRLPYIPGGDCAGLIQALGDGVDGLRAGDRVFVSAALGRDLSGCYADYVVRPAINVLRLPETISFAQAAAIGVPFVTAHIALFARGRARAGETLFIHGASGAVGTAAIQLARRAGMRVIGSAGSAEGLERLANLGAVLAVDHTKPDYLEAVRTATHGAGPALILEMLADKNLATDMALAAKFGRIVIIGCRGEVTLAPRLAMMKELDILGTAIWNIDRALVEAALADITAGLADGSLSPQVGQTFALADAAAAHRAVLAPATRGKIVLT